MYLLNSLFVYFLAIKFFRFVLSKQQTVKLTIHFLGSCGHWSKYNGFLRIGEKVSTLQQFSDQRNSWSICHHGLTWNSGEYASDKIPASRYVPGLVWNVYQGLQNSSDELIFISCIYAQITPLCTDWMSKDQRGHIHQCLGIIHLIVSLEISQEMDVLQCVAFRNTIPA